MPISLWRRSKRHSHKEALQIRSEVFDVTEKRLEDGDISELETITAKVDQFERESFRWRAGSNRGDRRSSFGHFDRTDSIAESFGSVTASVTPCMLAR